MKSSRRWRPPPREKDNRRGGLSPSDVSDHLCALQNEPMAVMEGRVEAGATARRTYTLAMEDGPVYSRRRLPHIDMKGAVYFVTWLLHRGLPDLTEAERDLMQETLLHFRGERYRLFAWVVMNDHVHVLFQPLGEFTRSMIMHSWKSFTANQFQRHFGRHGVGSIWQSEGHDHIIRNEQDLYEKWQYILDNPLKRWPDGKDYKWVSKPTEADSFG